MLKELLEEILLTESASADQVNAAIDNHNRVIINYHTDGGDVASGARVIEVYAYGLTKAGNPVIRAFQPFGDTTSTVPSWKFFRLDRISYWEPTNQKFSNPASERYPGLGEFNKSGDKTMSMVYKVAKFDNNQTNPTERDKEELFKTSTQTGMERLKQQLDNPITIADLQRANQKQPETSPEEPKTDVYKTPTERSMDRLKQQLANPTKIDLSKFEKKPPQEKEPSKEDSKKIEQAREKIRNIGDTIKKGDLEKMLDEPQTPTEEPKSDVYRTETERGMDDLKNKLQNARKIDLSKIPKR